MVRYMAPIYKIIALISPQKVYLRSAYVRIVCALFPCFLFAHVVGRFLSSPFRFEWTRGVLTYD